MNTYADATKEGIGDSMTKTDMIRNNIEQNNGYLFMSEIEDFGISRTYILRYVKDNELGAC